MDETQWTDFCSSYINENKRELLWIDIDKELPTKDALYIIHVETADKNKPYIGTAWYNPNGFGWSLLPDVFIPCITHWMEMPKPPKNESTHKRRDNAR